MRGGKRKQAAAGSAAPQRAAVAPQPAAPERPGAQERAAVDAAPASAATDVPASDAAARKGYAKRIIARAKVLRDYDAFEVRERPGSIYVSAEQALEETRAARRVSRMWVLVFALLCAAIAAFSLLLPYYGIDSMGAGGTVYAPAEVLACYRLWFQMHVLPLFDATLANQTGALYAAFAQEHPDVTYSLVMNRAAVTLITCACGILLAASGLLFQTAFRNPLAAPSSLGVSDGVTLGCIIYLMLGNTSIGDDPALYLALVYGCGVAVVVAVLFLSRAMTGSARYNVLDMLLLGTVLCQLLGGLNSFVQNFVMDDAQWYNFYDIQQAADALTEPLLQAVVAVMFVVTFVPALLLRFKLNLISFTDEEGTMMGVRAGLLRALALALGSAMQLAAIASIGQVAMLSLAVPFLVRYLMPADFGSQFLGNCIVGVAVLLACVALQHFATVGIVTMPVGTIVSIFIVPFFVWMMALGRGRW